MWAMRTLSGANIQLDQVEAQRILDTLAAIPGAAIRATVRAANKTATQAKKQALQQLSIRNQLPQKVFKGRVFIRRANKNQVKIESGIWIGTQPLDAAKVGELEKTADGYRFTKKVAKRWMHVQSAFEAKMPSGHVGVFMRAPGGYVSKRGSKGRTKGRPATSSRNLPIVKPWIDVDLGGQIILQNLQANYLKTLGQEANLEIQIALGNIKR